MKRTASLRRTSMRPPPRPPKVYEHHTPRPRLPANPLRVSDTRATARVLVQRPKEVRVEDEGYRRLVAKLPCINCNAYGASQAAHPNTLKAKSRKACDTLLFPLCTITALDCHGRFDRYELYGRERQSVIEPVWARQTQEAVRRAAAGDDRAMRVVLRVLGPAS